MAQEIQGVTIETITEHGLKKFGAITSGQVLLYNHENKLVFSGGITRLRGHDGPSSGSTMIGKHI